MTHSTTTMARRIMVGATAVLFATALSGCSVIDDLLGSGQPTRDEETQEITEEGDADVFSLKVGDCLNDVSGTEVSEVPVVPCDQPHDLEVFHEFTMPDGDFPGDDAINEAAITECDTAFATFVGVSYEESVLDWYPLTPLEDGWNNFNDRLVQCLIFEPDVQTTGTLSGAGR